MFVWFLFAHYIISLLVTLATASAVKKGFPDAAIAVIVVVLVLVGVALGIAVVVWLWKYRKDTSLEKSEFA